MLLSFLNFLNKLGSIPDNNTADIKIIILLDFKTWFFRFFILICFYSMW